MNRIQELKEMIEGRRQSDLDNPGIRMTEEYSKQCMDDELELARLLPEEGRSDYQKYIILAEDVGQDNWTGEQKRLAGMFGVEFDA